MTNGDKIRAMTDDVDLSFLLSDVKIDGLLRGRKYPGSLTLDWIEWLQQDVEPPKEAEHDTE